MNKHLGVCLVGLVATVTLHDEIITIFASRSLTLVVFCWAFTPFVKPFAALQGVRVSVQAKLCRRIRTECRRLDAATWQNAMVRYEYGMNQFSLFLQVRTCRLNSASIFAFFRGGGFFSCITMQSRPSKR